MNHVLSRLFRPLARLAIARGLRFADVSDCLRRAFVDAARHMGGADVPVSRLSVMTGLQRRDVTRLLHTPEAPSPQRPDPMSRLVAQWQARFAGRPLPHHGDEGSFDALARTILQDVHPRSILDRLIAANTVEMRDGAIHLLKSGYVPLEGSDAQIQYLGENVGDHLAVAVGNVLGDDPAFDLAVHYNGLSAEAVRDLEDLWRKRMKSLLQDMNARALEHQTRSHGQIRFRAGGYFRAETQT